MKNLPTTEERVWAVLAHLSAIAFGMGILIPVVGWSEQRRKSNYASFQSLQALGYQSLGYTIWLLTILVVVMFTSLSAVAGIVNAANPQEQVTSVVLGHTALLLGLTGVYFVLPVIGAVFCALGKDFRYPLMGNRLARYLGYEFLQIGEEQTWLNEAHEDRWVVAMGHFSIIIALWGMLIPLSAWILQGKRSLFLKFQSVQTLIFQLGVMLLYFVAGAVYIFGIFSLLIAAGLGQAESFDTSGGVLGLAILFGSMLVAMLIVLIIPLFHIWGQWAGYRVLKGDNYRYALIGRLVEKRITGKVNSVVEEKAV
jgi:uncharacterized Tic20 family protein